MRFSKSDILEALGIEQESGNEWLGHSLAGFGIGCVVGAAVAMLLAPKSGKELREDIAERGRDLFTKGRQVTDQYTGEDSEPPTQAF